MNIFHIFYQIHKVKFELPVNVVLKLHLAQLLSFYCKKMQYFSTREEIEIEFPCNLQKDRKRSYYDVTANWFVYVLWFPRRLKRAR